MVLSDIHRASRLWCVWHHPGEIFNRPGQLLLERGCHGLVGKIHDGAKRVSPEGIIGTVKDGLDGSADHVDHRNQGRHGPFGMREGLGQGRDRRVRDRGLLVCLQGGKDSGGTGAICIGRGGRDGRQGRCIRGASRYGRAGAVPGGDEGRPVDDLVLGVGSGGREDPLALPGGQRQAGCAVWLCGRHAGPIADKIGAEGGDREGQGSVRILLQGPAVEEMVGQGVGIHALGDLPFAGSGMRAGMAGDAVDHMEAATGSGWSRVPGAEIIQHGSDEGRTVRHGTALLASIVVEAADGRGGGHPLPVHCRECCWARVRGTQDVPAERLQGKVEMAGPALTGGRQGIESGRLAGGIQPEMLTPPVGEVGDLVRAEGPDVVKYLASGQAHVRGPGVGVAEAGEHEG